MDPEEATAVLEASVAEEGDSGPGVDMAEEDLDHHVAASVEAATELDRRTQEEQLLFRPDH